MVEYLLLKGIDPQKKNKFNETAIFSCAENGSVEVLNMLAKDSRSNINQEDKFGNVILHIAARNGQADIIEYIMSSSYTTKSRK